VEEREERCDENEAPHLCVEQSGGVDGRLGTRCQVNLVVSSLLLRRTPSFLLRDR